MEPTISEEDARRAHRVLRAVWMIASARHEDAVAADVARLGESLRRAIDAHDWRAARLAVDEVRAWMATMAGVIASRMTRVFES
jgi:hypothetical protein